jgi:hypothetical protein
MWVGGEGSWEDMAMCFSAVFGEAEEEQEGWLHLYWHEEEEEGHDRACVPPATGCVLPPNLSGRAL